MADDVTPDKESVSAPESPSAKAYSEISAIDFGALRNEGDRYADKTKRGGAYREVGRILNENRISNSDTDALIGIWAGSFFDKLKAMEANPLELGGREAESATFADEQRWGIVEEVVFNRLGDAPVGYSIQKARIAVAGSMHDAHRSVMDKVADGKKFGHLEEPKMRQIVGLAAAKMEEDTGKVIKEDPAAWVKKVTSPSPTPAN